MKDTLLIKWGQIAKLKRYFEVGIQNVTEEIWTTKEQNHIQSLAQARQHPRVVLGLETLNRRRSQVHELEKPLQQLDTASQDIDFVLRKTELDLQMLPFTRNMDEKRLSDELSTVVSKYQPLVERIEAEAPSPKRFSIESAWKLVDASHNKSPVAVESPVEKEPALSTSTVKKKSRDRDVLAALCGGDFSAKSELAHLTPEIAACLAKDSSPDLFLNRITELSPETARHLKGWKGRWLVLNGLRVLDPQAAWHLSQWPGEWLSLNGLRVMSPQTARYLAGWGGRRLELTGLVLSPGKKNEAVATHLKHWEQSGRQLYVSSGVRKRLTLSKTD